MTTPARMRPLHPAAHLVADLVSTFGLVARGALLPADAVLTGVSLASGDVVPGDVFVAVTGFRVHGAAYAPQAVDAGAVAVLTDESGFALLEDSGLARRIPVLVADDPRAIAGPVAAWAHDAPGQRLVTVGVTGTNGKTTTAYFLDAALRAAHATTVVLGTVELRIG